MNPLELLIKGVLAGFLIAAPIGPVNVLCVSRTLSKGWKSGFVSSLGAAAADALYGLIAGVSLNFVIRFFIREEFWIRLFGGSFLILVGILYYFKRPRLPQSEGGMEESGSAFLLALANATEALSFIALLAALGITRHRPPWLTILLVSGIFCGSLLWFTILITLAHRVRDRFNEGAMLWLNRIAGLLIGGFGVYTLVLARA
jgi:threonine/homoserine/homoserine lactone efflux protein